MYDVSRILSYANVYTAFVQQFCALHAPPPPVISSGRSKNLKQSANDAPNAITLDSFWLVFAICNRYFRTFSFFF